MQFEPKLRIARERGVVDRDRSAGVKRRAAIAVCSSVRITQQLEGGPIIGWA
jgi:hypothetical protein